MNQNIIVFIIVGLTAAYAIYSFVKKLRIKKTSSSCGCCSGCEFKKTI